MAWKRYCLYRSGKNWDQYKQLRNEVNQSIRAEEEYNRKLILKSFKNQPKKFYGFMRNQQTVKDQVTVLKKSDGEMTTSDQDRSSRPPIRVLQRSLYSGRLV